MRHGCVSNLLFGFLLLLAFGGSSYFWFTYFVKGRSLPTPNLIGKTVAEARAISSDLGVNLDVRQERRFNRCEKSHGDYSIGGLMEKIGKDFKDIDILIQRTLVYGTLTAMVTLVYVGLVFTLQLLLRGLISQTNDVALVVSTLVVAALFQPLRRRIQRVIDRRFYRRKYDAAKTLEAFSVKLRSEVDLAQLREQLVTVVEETMQPAHVSLWLRPRTWEVKRTTRLLPHLDKEEGL